MAIQVEGSNRIQPHSSANHFITNQSFRDNPKSQSGEHLQNLQKGEVLEGKVLHSTENTITIEVNGKPIEARLEGNFEFVQGEVVRLTVLDAGAEKILLKSGPENLAVAEKRIEDILLQLNLKVSPENKELIQELMTAKLPLSQENLRTLQLMMQKYPEVNLKSMVLLLKNKIPLTDHNINELLKTQNKSDLLATKLDDIIGKLSKLLQSEKGNLFFSKLMEGNEKGEQLLSDLKNIAEGRESLITGEKELKLSSFINKGEVVKLARDVEQIMQSLTKPAAFQSAEESAKPIISRNLLQSIAGSTPEETLKLFREVLSNLKEGLMNGNIKTVDSFFAKAEGLTPELKEVLRAVLSERLSMGLLRKEILLSTKEKDPAAQLEKIYEKLGQLKNTEDSSMVARNILRDVLSARDSMTFMSKFQDNAGFLQLPFILGDKVLNGELFVLNNNKNKKKVTNDDISALLQLDFATLGHLDTFIKKNGNQIAIDFYMQDKEKEQWIKEKIHLLHNSLMDKNYHVVAINTYTKKEKTDGFADFLANDQVTKVSRFSFDMRA